MYFPPLRTIANPSGPRWADVLLSTQEAEAFLRRMVMVVGYDDRDGKSMVLGSGFLVGTQPDLIVLTATHVLTEWADKVRPPAPHAFSGLQGDGEHLRDRLDQLIQANLIRVVVHSRPAGQYHLCKVGSLTVTANPRDIDVSCMLLIPPKGATATDFDAFAVDAGRQRIGQMKLQSLQRCVAIGSGLRRRSGTQLLTAALTRPKVQK